MALKHRISDSPQSRASALEIANANAGRVRQILRHRRDDNRGQIPIIEWAEESRQVTAAARPARVHALVPVPASCRPLPSHGFGCYTPIHISALRHDSRQEPYAVMLHERICAGGRERSPSLPRTLHGRMSKKQRGALVVRLDALPPDPRILLATGKLVGEGFDHPHLDTLVLAMPVCWKGTLQQYPAACTGSTPPRPVFGSSISSAPATRHCSECGTSASADTRLWDIASWNPRLESVRKRRIPRQ